MSAKSHLGVGAVWAGDVHGAQAAVVALLRDELHRLALAQAPEAVGQDAGLRVGMHRLDVRLLL